MDILKKIEQHRAAEERLQWEGTFAEYLELVKERPWVAQTAHSRIYNMIKDAELKKLMVEESITSLVISSLD